MRENNKVCFLLIILFSVTLTSAFAEESATTVGTERTELMLLMHQRHQAQFSSADTAIPTKSTDIGNIAVMNADSRILIPANPFDLGGRKITFTREQSSVYRLKVSTGSIAAMQGKLVSVGVGKQVKFQSGFRFPFYGVTYDSIFISRCGYLSFQPFVDYCYPDLVTTLQGPPLIMPFTGVAGSSIKVRMLQEQNNFRVTWNMLDEAGNLEGTLQVNLFSNGDIEMILSSGVFFDYEGFHLLTGISPGNTTLSKLTLIDFSTVETQRTIRNAVFERFSISNDIDVAALLYEFHRRHPKVFDFVTVFTDRSYVSGQSYIPIQNSIQGIGEYSFDYSKSFGSSRIQEVIMMNSLGQYPSDPNSSFQVEGQGSYTTLSMLAQLTGRRWLAYPSVMIGGVKSYDLLGIVYGDYKYRNGLWNFFMDTDASLMGGNNIKSNGDGTFVTLDSLKRYSRLDQYLMGLISSKKVPPFFFVRTVDKNTGRPPQEGVKFSGTKVNLGIQQIMRAEGPRIPSSETSQKEFKDAFLFLISPGTQPDPAKVAQINRTRINWEKFFDQATNHHGRMNTLLH